MNKSTKEEVTGNYRSFPNWIKFLIFIAMGFYRGGGWRYNYQRILCWFDRHEYTLYFHSLEETKVKFYEHQELKDGSQLKFSLQCRHCGQSERFEAIYRGFDEYRLKSKLHI